MAFLLRVLAVCALVVAVIAPATAGASGRTALGHRPAARAPGALALAATVARRYWGADPCQGRIQTRSRQSVPAGLLADSDAWVTFDSSLGANNLLAPASGYTGCTISFSRSRWPTTASMDQDWDMLCMTMTHEFGHLLGHAHSLTPGSVMAAVFTNYSGEPQRCRTTRPRAHS